MDTNANAAINDPSVSRELEAHPLRGLASISTTPRASRQVGSLDWRQALGIGLIVLGAISIVVAWYGVSGTLDPGKQMPYISSGGFGGAVLIAVGVTLLSSFEHARDRAALEVILDRLDAIDLRLEDMEARQDEASQVIVLDEPPVVERRPRAPRTARPATTRATTSGSSARTTTRTRARS